MLTESLKILESKLVEVSRDAEVSAINANIGRIKGKINASETALKKVEKDLRVAQKAGREEVHGICSLGGRAILAKNVARMGLCPIPSMAAETFAPAGKF